MAGENRGTHRLYEKGKAGEMQIANGMVATMAGLAATKTGGVDPTAGNITNEPIGKLRIKNLNEGVEVGVTREHVSMDLSLNVRYGYNIPAVNEQAQDRVSAAIENTAGLTMLGVNIKIADVSIDEGKQQRMQGG